MISIWVFQDVSPHFLVCITGGSLLWNLELKEVSLGLFSLTILLVPGVTYDFYIHYSYYVVLIMVFICSDTLVKDTVSKHPLPTPNTHK